MCHGFRNSEWQWARTRSCTEDSRNSASRQQGGQLTSISQSRRIARIFGCRRGCRCKKCLSLKYVLSLFNMIFQTSSRFAQLQKTKPSRKTGDGVSVPHHRPPPPGGARGAGAARLLQHRQGWGSRWPGALRLVPRARAHQLILFFVRCGDQGAGVFTDWITVPWLERKSTFLNVCRKPAGFTFTVL